MVGEGRVKPIRLAIIGAGIYARDAHTPALLRLRDRFQVAAVCARSLASADALAAQFGSDVERCTDCLLYTSPSPRDRTRSRMPSSA